MSKYIVPNRKYVSCTGAIWGIPQTLIHRLSFRFKHIVLLFDTDKTGLESSLKREEELRQYGVKRLVLPLSGQKEEKDISDYFALGNSREDLIRLRYTVGESMSMVHFILLGAIYYIDLLYILL